MNNDIETTLQGAGKQVTLTAAELDVHRAAIRSFMQEKPRAPVVSPFSWMLLQQTRFVMAALLLVVAGGTGVTLAAESSSPGDMLYAVKVHLTEPARVALAQDAEEKGGLYVSFADRRLSEFAAASLEGNLDEETTDTIFESLEDNLTAAQSEIRTLRNAGESDEALAISTELRSVLSAHAAILDEVDALNTKGDMRVEALSDQIDEDLADAEAEAAELTSAVDPGEEGLSEAVTEQRDEVSYLLADIRTSLREEIGSLDAADKSAISADLDATSASIAEALTKESEGDAKGAFLLLNEAKSSLQELKTLIKAEQSLGIDVVSEDDI